jgi:hypothetical protein
MQSAGDVFLGWTRGKNGRDYYVRQLRDVKLSVIVEDWDVRLLRMGGSVRGRWRARMFRGCRHDLGIHWSSETFDDAICEFAAEYADQNQRDYKAFVKAVREKRVEAAVES